MIIKQIKLQNFRNYQNLDLEFSGGVNIITGNNAQGKTNLVEAIFLCAIGKSLRVSRENELINFNQEFANIELFVQKKYRKCKIFMFFSKKAKKSIRVDGIPIKKISQLVGEFNAVYFSPDELKLIKDSPADRRRFFDIHLSQTSKQYFYTLSRYEKILANRNKLLKEDFDSENIRTTLSIWDAQLVEMGSRVIFERLKFVEQLKTYAATTHNFLSSNNENLTMEYVGINKSTLEEIKAEFQKQLSKNFEKDVKLGFTNTGPHRDDLKICIDNIDVRIYGSQGQQRTTALSLKLAELEIMKDKIGEMPVLLLDDVLSELDINRREKLLAFCQKTQTFITCTDFPYNPNYTYLQIQNGKVVNT